MNETKTFHTSLAVIADIHGNRWVLEAVLQDIDRRGIQQIVNLGDHLTGPLDPAGTADLLIARTMANVCGNDDRELFLPQEKRSLSQNYTCTQLTPAHVAWLHSLPDTTIVADDLGFATVWLSDQFHTFPQPVQEMTFECWATISARHWHEIRSACALVR